ncbi:DMT family transporter [Pleomorphomonas koreensis]|uniref:DMT family transporter n=1 Tax=Pleomorphomonas koreensis TaxID=257440 RepID=UPI00041C74F7|nr:DMT family transporter [Pleomorphomonas koreensis]
MTDFRDTLRGIVAMLLSCLFFIINDTAIKVTAEGLPLGQVLFLRSVLATAVVLVIVWKMGLLPRVLPQTSRFVLTRSIVEGVTTLAYIGGLMHLPIANASAIAQATPLALTAAGAILLGEAVGWRRWLSVAVGFCGILIIVRPGPDGFNAWALLILLSVVLVTIRELSTRFIAPNTDTAVVSLVTQVMVTIACGLLAATEVWQPMDMMQIGLIVLASVGCLLGVHFSIDAMRHGDISLVAQFRYSFIPFAIFLGWLVWGDVPDLLTFVGIAVVAGSGIYVFYRERVRHQLLASRAEPGI